MWPALLFQQVCSLSYSSICINYHLLPNLSLDVNRDEYLGTEFLKGLGLQLIVILRPCEAKSVYFLYVRWRLLCWCPIGKKYKVVACFVELKIPVKIPLQRTCGDIQKPDC